tara:strand:- start:977 stop:1297 length:321 start_codon:yes stop_codon:yes gene_type:complete
MSDDVDDLADLANDAIKDEASEQVHDEMKDMLKRKLKENEDGIRETLLETVLSIAEAGQQGEHHGSLWALWRECVACKKEWMEEAENELEAAASYNQSREDARNHR